MLKHRAYSFVSQKSRRGSLVGPKSRRGSLAGPGSRRNSLVGAGALSRRGSRVSDKDSMNSIPTAEVPSHQNLMKHKMNRQKSNPPCRRGFGTATSGVLPLGATSFRQVCKEPTLSYYILSITSPRYFSSALLCR
eukprot:872770-Prorocentrum_minimum.AAC.3